MRIEDWLDYNPDTGSVIWKQGRMENREAGTTTPEGYIKINLKGKYYQAHRLCWYLKEGYFPEGLIDHKDRNRSNNVWSNLREVSKSCNGKNCNLSKNSTTGVTGVTRHLDKYTAAIMSLGVSHYLGRYSTIEEAAYARFAGEQCLDFTNCDKESTAVAYIKSLQHKGV